LRTSTAPHAAERAVEVYGFFVYARTHPFGHFFHRKSRDSVGPVTQQVSELLVHWGQGDRKALQALLPLLYEELRNLARYHLQRQRSNHTLQSTALVHEVYLRLAGQRSLKIENRSHFLAIAAQVMRWVLVDYERHRAAAKRGGNATRLTLSDGVAKPQRSDVDLLVLDEALNRLAKLDSQQSRIVELRYFGGLSIEDTSEFLGISAATVKRSWASARAWLLREMSPGEGLNERRTLATSQANP
jgi:RNA polymerase sigma factor (TIGR02999 family)